MSLPYGLYHLIFNFTKIALNFVKFSRGGVIFLVKLLEFGKKWVKTDLKSQKDYEEPRESKIIAYRH